MAQADVLTSADGPKPSVGESPLVAQQLRQGDPDALPVPMAREQYRSVQALRAIAAFMVIVSHTAKDLGIVTGSYKDVLGPLQAGGAFGVDLFFCISGFIIFLTTHDARGNLSVSPRKFAKKRFLRIYPSYWLATTFILVLFAAGFVAKFDQPLSLPYLVKSLLLLPQSTSPVLGPGWTLVHEVKFYVLYILIVAVFAQRYLWGLVLWTTLSAGVFALSLFEVGFLDRNLLGRAANYLFHPSSLEFIGGVFLAKYLTRIAPQFSSRLLLPLLALLSAAVLFGCAELKPGGSMGIKYFGVALYFPVCLLMLTVCAALEVQGRLGAREWLVKLGDASYSTYLFHRPFLLLIRPLLVGIGFGSLTGTLIGLVVVCCCVQAVAWLYYVKLDNPLYLSLRKRLQ